MKLPINSGLRISLLSCLIVFLSFLTAGCWDRKEIEKQGFVLGLAIDYASPEPKGRYDLPGVSQEAGKRKYRITYELPKLRKSEGEKEAVAPGQHVIFTGEGESILAITRAMSAKTYQSLFLEDLQIMVISEAVAREGIGALLDFFTRDPGIRRRVQLLIAPGRAEDILRGRLQVEEVNSIYIAKIARNVNQIPRFSSKADLGDMSEAIRSNRSFFMPLVVMEKGEVRLTGVALFNKDAKYVGRLDEFETVGAKIIRTVLRKGAFPVSNPLNPAELVVFDLLEPRMKINSLVEGDRLWFVLDVKLVGHLGENSELGRDALAAEFLAAVEQALAAEFTRQVEAAYFKAQTLKVDVLDLGSLVHRQHPKLWKKIEKNWDDEVFPTVPLKVNIKVIVRRPGTTR